MTDRKKNKKIKFVFVVCCLFFLSFIAGAFIFSRDLFPVERSAGIPLTKGVPEETAGQPSEPSLTEIYGKRLNLLLLGIDVYEENTGRTDTIILASIDTEKNQVDLLSIPRDTRVQIKDYGWDKINHAMVYGGPDLTMNTVSELLDIPLRYYVVTNFNGFEDIIDILGGVTMDVEKDMKDIKKGVQRLDGEKALKYVRYRDYPKADIDRIAHQLKFLKTLNNELLQTDTITKLPDLVPALTGCIDSNLSPADLYRLASAAKKMGGQNVSTHTLPGQPVMINKISYWAVEPNQSRLMAAKIVSGETAGESN